MSSFKRAQFSEDGHPSKGRSRFKAEVTLQERGQAAKELLLMLLVTGVVSRGVYGDVLSSSNINNNNNNNNNNNTTNITKAITGGGNYTVLSSRCEQRRESGLCRANLPRWHYDPHVRSCHRFAYGGCGANLNNFVSEQQCYAVCHREEVTCPPELTNNKTCELSEKACTTTTITCPSHPEAVCRVDPCSCVVEFVDKDGRVVIECDTTTTTTPITTLTTTTNITPTTTTTTNIITATPTTTNIITPTTTTNITPTPTTTNITPTTTTTNIITATPTTTITPTPTTTTTTTIIITPTTTTNIITATPTTTNIITPTTTTNIITPTTTTPTTIIPTTTTTTTNIITPTTTTTTTNITTTTPTIITTNNITSTTTIIPTTTPTTSAPHDDNDDQEKGVSVWSVMAVVGVVLMGTMGVITGVGCCYFMVARGKVRTIPPATTYLRHSSTYLRHSSSTNVSVSNSTGSLLTDKPEGQKLYLSTDSLHDHQHHHHYAEIKSKDMKEDVESGCPN
ncbi:hypothetical protein Pcinc_012504 [Petrolisthes cinctipes]|uniref:BPTI/Kunitz inhibitor domain-containing protein n=1 Tax=Petrolisthes cinctipes TaxID=88211 RepID=A0AAE1G4M2_PETCI|nr:hypothetical protein Pcinc_012504 [Petrolisthes cinctipes]